MMFERDPFFLFSFFFDIRYENVWGVKHPLQWNKFILRNSRYYHYQSFIHITFKSYVKRVLTKKFSSRIV